MTTDNTTPAITPNQEQNIDKKDIAKAMITPKQKDAKQAPDVDEYGVSLSIYEQKFEPKIFDYSTQTQLHFPIHEVAYNPALHYEWIMDNGEGSLENRLYIDGIQAFTTVTATKGSNKGKTIRRVIGNGRNGIPRFNVLCCQRKDIKEQAIEMKRKANAFGKSEDLRDTLSQTATAIRGQISRQSKVNMDKDGSFLSVEHLGAKNLANGNYDDYI